MINYVFEFYISLLLLIDVVKHLFGITKPKIIFCDGVNYEKVKEATKKFKPTIFTLCTHLREVKKIDDLLEPTTTERVYQ